MFAGASTVCATLLGLYNRKRHKFSSDYTYNKYHFGVLCNLAANYGLYTSRKLIMSQSYVPGLLFIAAISFTSIPGYIEGFTDVRMEPASETDTSMLRILGIYALMGGYTILTLRLRRNIL
jgi:hypothetical protein